MTLTVSIIIASLLVIPAAYSFYVYATRPYRWEVRISDLHSYVETLLRRGYDGSFMIVQEPGSDRFVQIAKYIREKGQIGLELAFPKTTWSSPYYSLVEKMLGGQGIGYRRRSVMTKPTDEFLEVDFQQDTAAAFSAINNILTTVFKLPSSAIMQVHFSSLSLSDELVDSTGPSDTRK